jgi:hypothetical protein
MNSSQNHRIDNIESEEYPAGILKYMKFSNTKLTGNSLSY